MNKDNISKSPSGRVQRTPVGKRNIMTVRGKDAGFEYRFVNDDDSDRIEQFKAAGYEVVLAKDVKVGDNRVDKASDQGTVATVAKGGTTSVLMRIKKEWFDEDQEAKARSIKELEDTTRLDPHGGDYGEIKITRS